jgi:hypothetical protein
VARRRGQRGGGNVVSPFTGVFATVTITRQVRVPPTPPDVLTYDAAGQPVYPTALQSLVVIADPAPSGKYNSLREQAGASLVGALLTITCVDPMQAPANIVPGVEFAMTYEGQAGVLRIVDRPAETLSPVAEALGSVLYGAWRADP